MHQYYYDLQIYEDLIYGELEPVRLNGDKIQLGIHYLNEEVGQCQDMQILKLRIRKDNFEVLEKHNISNAHPLAHNYFPYRDIKFDEDIEDLISKRIRSLLNINPKKVAFTVTKAKNNIHHVGVCENTSWNQIDHQRIKYCYYFQMLSECKKKIKRAVNLSRFEYNETEFKKLIENIQKLLMNYLKELNQAHEINPDLLNYRIKENYTDEDCMSLVYISLIELLNYLYENCNKEFDKTFPVPYYSEKINKHQINQKIEIIDNQLGLQQVDPALHEILEEQFNRIRKFNHPSRLTYHELDYFVVLFSQLSRHLLSNKNRPVTTYHIVSLLISFKFNNHKFIQFVTNEIRKDLDTISGYRNRLIYLLEQENSINQSIGMIKIHFDPLSKDVSKTIKAWIHKETNLINEYIKNSEFTDDVVKTETYKLETTLTAKQLAFLIKTLSDSDIFVSKSQTELARWISANFKTTVQDNISIEQSRNNLYTTDPKTLEKIKSVAIEITNIINEVLHAKN